MQLTKDMKNDFDEFLKEDGILEEVSSKAIKKL